MNAWLTINGLLSLSLLLALPLLSGAPARLKLWLSLAAMLCWCLPLQPITIGSGTVPLLEVIDLVPIEAATFDAAPAPMQRTPSAVDGSALLMLALLIGLVWFLIDWHQARRQIQQWRQHSIPLDRLSSDFRFSEDLQIRVVRDSDLAVTTGLLRPVIWIGDRWIDRPQWRVILTHERTHADRGDPRWLFAVQLLRRLFWWNPLILLLARRAHQYIEWSCDEVCTRELGSDTYTDSLLCHWQLRHADAVAGLAFPFRSATVERIQRLQQETHMTRTHKLILALLAMITTITLVQAGTTGRSSTSVMQDDSGQVELEFENTPMDRFADVMTQVTGLQVRIHPDLADERINGSYRCSDSGCHKALTDLTPADVSFRYAGNQIHVATESVLSATDASWLDEAINGQHRQPVPPPRPATAQSVPTPPMPTAPGQASMAPPPAPPARPGPSQAAPQPPTPPSAPAGQSRPAPDQAPQPDAVPEVRSNPSSAGTSWHQGLWLPQAEAQANC